MSKSENPDIDISAEDVAKDAAEQDPKEGMMSKESAEKETVVDNEAEEVEVEEIEADTPEEDVSEDAAELTVDGLAAELVAAQEEISTLKDSLLREKAETQNVRKRLQRDVENAHKYGLEKFLTNVLPVIDSLEKAVESAGQSEDSNSAVVEGVELCLKMMLEILAKENVVQIFPEGEPFDPQFHEAMSVIENPDVEPNTVVNVFQKGYTLNERLVRPAMVIVSKASA
jgi:molecular chaperone GrpE